MPFCALSKAKGMIIFMEQKFKKIIIGLLVGFAAILLLVISLKDNKKNINKTDIAEVQETGNEKSSVEEFHQELMNVSEYLEKLDETVLTNQETLSAISGTNETFINQAEILEQEISRVVESIIQFLSLYETGDEEIRNQLSEVLTELEDARAGLEKNHKEALATFEKMDDKQKNRQEILEKNLSIVKESIIDVKGKLEQSQIKLLSMLDTMKAINEEIHEEDISYMEYLYQQLSELIIKDTEQLLMMIETSDSRIQLQINAVVKSLSTQMSGIHSQIAVTQEELVQLLSVVENGEKARQVEVIESFESVKASLFLIQDDFASAHSEVKRLFQDMKDKADRTYSDLITVLGQMDKNMEESSLSNVIMLIETLDHISEQYKEAINQINEQYVEAINQINQNHVELRDEMGIRFSDVSSSEQIFNLSSDINNQFDTIKTDINNQFSNLYTGTGDQYDNLAELINNGNEGIRKHFDSRFSEVNQKIDSVFQSVSSGKKLLASALLTKGITISGDATFYTISQAILEIPQNMEFESQEMQASISYDYHFHLNAAGANPHTEQQEQKGGCYVIPVTHVHSGNSAGGGCYTAPVYHTHSGNSTSGGGCYNAVNKCGGTIATRWEEYGNTYYHGHDATKWCSTCQKDVTYCVRCQSTPHNTSTCAGYFDVGHRAERTIYYCSKCGTEYGGGGTCTKVTGYTIGCGKSNSTIESYQLGCGKTAETVEYYLTGCGFIDRQVVGVHIIYYSNNAKS